jgi:tripartite-type tricarboxylate transporter receptor subunit TctC
LRSPGAAEKLRAAGVDPVGSTPSEFTEFVKRELARWVGAARKANITPE